MRILITGANGFVGSHLSQHLNHIGPDDKIYGAVLDVSPEPDHIAAYDAIDLRNYSAVLDLMDRRRPDQIYHLAAQAFVPRSFEDPWETLENNILGQLNLIRACLELGIHPRFLVISSAELYGAAQPEEMPLNESAPMRPSNPYSVSKVAQDMLGLQYFISHKLPIMRARPFNHIGPGQNHRFVAPAFAIQIARIEAGMQEPVLYVGNLAAKRDYTDVRDIVRAYALILSQGNPGEAYNVASGQAHSVQTLLDILLSMTDEKIEIRVDPDRLRPVDIPIIQGDASHLHAVTGWQPSISIEQTLRDILNDCRQRIKTSKEE